MARSLGGFLVLILAVSLCEAASIFEPISDSHRSAALELFTPIDGSFGSLEKTYEALRTFDILGIKKSDVSTQTCGSVSETLASPSSTLMDLFEALKVNGILKCKINEEIFEGVISRLQAAVNDANSLLEFHHSVGSLVLIKGQSSKTDLQLGDAEGIFRSIKVGSEINFIISELNLHIKPS
ncbi:dolichyl-diphosphooligosaccharide--protein glycosyltransferase subunit 2-like [Carica papaya]|uniref:dolichyl-diphosphooligosaccharide--protein glycosyltransferase subunit 2-like n=1 Tax=Carica papaya TaxID=3649 RepID=UPI000B8CD8DB|nr:dolichyl-diphosphooligosaccharide--protein glycosyltransferase subunit 2-like [Carica papaya]